MSLNRADHFYRNCLWCGRGVQSLTNKCLNPAFGFSRQNNVDILTLQNVNFMFFGKYSLSETSHSLRHGRLCASATQVICTASQQG